MTLKTGTSLFTAGGETFPLTFTRKRVKRINIRVRQDGSVTISAPYFAANAQVEDFLIRSLPLIKKARARFAACAPNGKSDYADGTKIPYRGGEITVALAVGKKKATLAGDTLTLTLPDPEDVTARKELFLSFLYKEAEAVLTARAQELYPLFLPRSAPFPSLGYSLTRSRWGVCYPTRNKITLSPALLLLPQALSDYVILHEFTHLSHPGHQADFHKALAKLLPDERARSRALAKIHLSEYI